MVEESLVKGSSHGYKLEAQVRVVDVHVVVDVTDVYVVFGVVGDFFSCHSS